LGPGLLESTYRICLAHELSKLNYAFEAEKSLPVCYDGIQLEAGYRIDLLVEHLVIVELK
jgi:GxxExxY protein